MANELEHLNYKASIDLKKNCDREFISKIEYSKITIDTLS